MCSGAIISQHWDCILLLLHVFHCFPKIFFLVSSVELIKEGFLALWSTVLYACITFTPGQAFTLLPHQTIVVYLTFSRSISMNPHLYLGMFMNLFVNLPQMKLQFQDPQVEHMIYTVNEY